MPFVPDKGQELKQLTPRGAVATPSFVPDPPEPIQATPSFLPDTEPGDRGLRGLGAQAVAGVTTGVGTLPGVGAGMAKTFIEKARTPVTVQIPRKLSDVPQTIMDIATLGIKLPTVVPRLITSQITKRTRLDEDITGALQGFIEKNQEKVGTFATENIADAPEGFMQKAVRAIGSGAPSLAIAAGITAAIGDPTAASVIFGSMAESQTFQDARRAGKTAQQAESIGAIRGIIEGGLEKFGLDAIFKDHGGFIRNAIRGAATEAMQEALQSIGQHAIEVPTFAQDRPWMEIAEDILYSALAGMFLGGGTSATIGLLNQKYPTLPPETQDKVAGAAQEITKQVTDKVTRGIATPKEVRAADVTSKIMESRELEKQAEGKRLQQELIVEQQRKLGSPAEAEFEGMSTELKALHTSPVRKRGITNVPAKQVEKYLDGLKRMVVQRGRPDLLRTLDDAEAAYLTGEFHNATEGTERLLSALHMDEIGAIQQAEEMIAELEQMPETLASQGTVPTSRQRKAIAEEIKRLRNVKGIFGGPVEFTAEIKQMRALAPGRVATPKEVRAAELTGKIMESRELEKQAEGKRLQQELIAEQQRKLGGERIETFIPGNVITPEDVKGKILLHGTKADFGEFTESKTGEFGPGVYLAQDEGTANQFGDISVGEGQTKILEVQPNLKNPVVIKKNDWIEMTQESTPREVQARLKAQGHDGIIGVGINDVSTQVVVFDPKQVEIKPPPAQPQQIGQILQGQQLPGQERVVPVKKKPVIPVAKRAAVELTTPELIAEAKQLGVPAFTQKGELKKGWTPKRLRIAVTNRRKKGPAAFREGFRAGARRRAQRTAGVEAVQEEFGLTDKELQKIHRREVGQMTDPAFEKHIEKLRSKAAGVAERKQAMTEVKGEIKRKKLKDVDNLRKAMKLPTWQNMKTGHIRQLQEAIAPYEQGDQFLSVRKLEVIDRDELMEGAKTWRQVKERLAAKLGMTIDELMAAVKIGEQDRFKGDVRLAQKDPFMHMVVVQVSKELITARAKFLEIKKEIMAKAAKLKPKAPRNLWRRLVDWAIPQQKIVFAYLEAPTREDLEKRPDASPDTATKEILASQMSAAELDLAKTIEKGFLWARDYLIEVKALRGMGVKNYMDHVRRNVLEAVKEDGIIAAFKEMWSIAKAEERSFEVMDGITGEVMAYDKHFKFAMHRSGVLKPTENVVKAYLTYMETFTKKRAMDKMLGPIMIYADALTPRGMSPKGLRLHGSLIRFMKEWLNTKKGRHIDAGVKQGGVIDRTIRAAVSMLALKDLALSLPVGLTVQLGEQATTYQTLGKKRYLKGKLRMLSKKGRRMIEQHREFIGENPWKELIEPAKSAGDRLSEFIFIMFSDATERANRNFFLGSLTQQEWQTETVSKENLAEMRLERGRYRQLEGAKSIWGATPVGRAWTMYKGWALPILSTNLRNINALADTLRKKKKFSVADKRRAVAEIYRMAEFTTIVLVIGASLKRDDDDNTFLGKLYRKANREILTLIGAMDPAMFLTAGRVANFVEDFGKNLSYIITGLGGKALGDPEMEKKLKRGATGLKRQVTPGAVRQFTGGKKGAEKKSPFI